MSSKYPASKRQGLGKGNGAKKNEEFGVDMDQN